MNISRFEDVVPKEGRMSSIIFENSNAGLAPMLVFSMNIPIQPFYFDDEKVSTALRLEFSHLSLIENWRAIFWQTYKFPVNPEEGYIEGSVYLGNVHNPADVTRLTFGEIEGGLLKCSADITIDFTFEGPEDLGIVELVWDFYLEIDESEIDRTVAKARKLAN